MRGIPANNATLFDLLQDHGLLLAMPDGKTIWKATVTSAAGWSNAFTFLKVSPALIWEANEERPPLFAGTVTVVAEDMPDEVLTVSPDSLVQTPVAEIPATAIPPLEKAPDAIPSNTSDGVDRLLELFDAAPDRETPEDEPQETVATIEATPQAIPKIPDTAEPEHLPLPENIPQEPSGEHFISWPRQRIANHILIINDAKALVHTVDNTVYLASPGIFQRYAQEHPKVSVLAKVDKLADWQWIRKRFEKLALHRKQKNSLNIWICEVAGPRKTHRLHGYLSKDPECLFDDTPPNNPYLSVAQETEKKSSA